MERETEKGKRWTDGERGRGGESNYTIVIREEEKALSQVLVCPLKRMSFETE